MAQYGTLTELEDNLFVRLRLIVLHHSRRLTKRRPPGAQLVALGAHRARQDDVGAGNRRRRDAVVDDDIELSLLYCVVYARGLGGHIGNGVVPLEPQHLHGIGLPALDRLQHDVRSRRRAQPELVHRGDVIPEALSAHVHVEVLEIAAKVGEVHAVGFARKVIAARLVYVSADGVEGHEAMGLGDAVHAHVRREAPLKRAWLRHGEHAGGVLDVLCIDPRDFGRLLRRHVLDALRKLIEAVCPVVDEFVIVQILLNNHVRHCHRNRRIDARARLNPDVGAGSKPG